MGEGQSEVPVIQSANSTSHVPSVDENISLASAADLDAEAARCSGGWAALVEGIAPGCLAQCQQHGICAVISEVVGTYTKTHNKKQVKRRVCKHKSQFVCLLWDEHRQKCQKLLDKAPQFGMPTSVGGLGHACQ